MLNFRGIFLTQYRLCDGRTFAAGTFTLREGGGGKSGTGDWGGVGGGVPHDTERGLCQFLTNLWRLEDMASTHMELSNFIYI
jgi:hypothetical protein